MDELVHHCLRELSFDGDLGCDVSRLRDFIVGFYTVDATHPQTVDDSFCAFVWSVIAQQPTVRVGTIPPGAATEVYIAPQTSARRKAEAKGEEVVEEDAPVLDVLPDATNRSLDDLKREYGDGLRIAVDPATSFAAITGSHLRAPKLSPMVYTALQFITRGREQGISVVDLGKKSKYDQKTCFYLVKQLMELDLIVKKKKSGVGTNFVIHKYFYERDLSWQQIRDEEAQAEEIPEAEHSPMSDGPDDNEADQKATVSFDAIDARHLSSLPLVRGRIVKLLKASQNNIHTSNNILFAIGFTNPTRPDRRFFQARLRELVAEGIVERVSVPNHQKKGITTYVKCLRLVSPDTGENVEGDNTIVEPEAIADDNQDIGFEDSLAEESGLKMNLTIHKQISDLLEEAGMRGMTLIELSNSLCHFDKRTIELLLNRAEKYPPPAHLSDLGTAELMETHGRERRHRYYTVATFRALAAREGLDDSATSYSNIDFSTVGGFASFLPNSFYDDEETLRVYVNSFKDKSNAGKERKNKVMTNPIMPDGSRKLGRPRKAQMGDSKKKEKVKASGERGRKRKRGDGDQDNGDGQENDAIHDAPVKKKRGRPLKKSRLDTDGGDAATDINQAVAQVASGSGQVSTTEVIIPKKRPRPQKQKPSDVVLETDDQGPAKLLDLGKETETDKPTVPKKSSRPLKKKLETTGIGDEALSASEDAHPKKHRRITRLNSPLLAEPGAPPGRSSLDGADVVVPSDVSTQPENENTLGEINAQSSQSISEKPRRSSRKQKRVVRDDEILIRKATGSKTTEAGVQTSTSLQSTDSRTTPPLIQTTQDQYSKLIIKASLHSANEPPQSSTVTIPIDPILTIQSETLPMISEPSPMTVGGQPDKPAGEVVFSRKSRPKVNVSHLRRDNELCRVIEGLGGIVNIHTKEFTDAHMNLIESMSEAGELTSAPVGTRLDKRTVESALSGMASRGRIKMLKTSLTTSTGVARPATIVYLPDTEPDKLNTFLAELGRHYLTTISHLPPINKIDEPLSYGSAQIHRAALPLQLLQLEDPGENHRERWKQNAARAAQLFTFDDATIREVLLTERTTVGQLYGFIVAKAKRVRQLHLAILDFFEKRFLSSRIVSHEHRIIAISFLYHDLPLATFCSVIGCLVHNDDVLQFLKTPEGQQTPVAKLPEKLHASLQIGRARTRSRFLDLLEILRSLGLVTPLRASESESAQFICVDNGDHPTAFDIASLEGWSTTSSINAPIYWRFNEHTSIHLWSQSETSPSFWKNVAVGTSLEAIDYWDNLEMACRNSDIALQTPGSSVGNATEPPNASTAVAKTLRRLVSWDKSYKLTWHQEQYLRRFVDPTTGNTPLQDDEASEAQLQKICWVTSASQEAVEKYFTKAHKKSTQELQQVRQKKKKRPKKNEEARNAAEAKAALQRKAAEAKLQREKDWDEILHRVHPEPLKGSADIRMRQVRSRFLQSRTGRDTQKWEGAIAQAIREVRLSAKEGLSKKRPLLSAGPPARIAPPPVVSAHSEKSVESLITQQGPPLARKEPAKRKGKKVEINPQVTPSEIQTNAPVRRGRFHWNRDYDELARDASTIIKVRCRNGARLDWAALEQVFPAVPKNSVRQRVVALREVPGAEPYLKRLEDAWHDLWSQHRGTEDLPDDDPQSPSNFDLIKHVKFLRRHIDKNAIRVGFAVEMSNVNLPASINDISRDWETVEKPIAGPVWDFLWNAQVEEGREKYMLRHPFTTNASDIPPTTDTSSETVHLAESVVKMVFGAPNESYDPESASRLLHSIGEEPTSAATSNLLSRGVLSKTMRDPKRCKPGRTLRISELNQNAIGGSIPRDTFQDASALEDIASNEDNGWRQWPLLATDGDNAALIQLVSEDKVKFKIDTSQPQAARLSLDWNSKKAGDDQIETLLNIQFHDVLDVFPESQSSEASPFTSHIELFGEHSFEHGTTVEGGPACCRKESIGLIDCLGCLESDMSTFLVGLDPADTDTVNRISTIVRNAGAQGTTKDELLVGINGPVVRVLALIHRMTESPTPQMFWTGYSTPVLVSSVYLRAWTVVISKNPRTMIFPRRWLDLAGQKILDVWEAALKAVIGVITFRPGVSQVELRWRLRSVYDRQEVNDILRHLLQDGILKRRWNPELNMVEQTENEPMMAISNEDEKNIFWFLGNGKHWYQV